MQVVTDHLMGALGRLLDPNGPTIRIAKLSKAELAALARAAGILEALRETWGGDDNHSLDTDVAMAAYTMRDLIELNGEVEV